MTEQLGEAINLPELIRHTGARLPIRLGYAKCFQKLPRRRFDLAAVVLGRRKLRKGGSRSDEAIAVRGATQLPVAANREQVRAREIDAEHLFNPRDGFGSR